MKKLYFSFLLICTFLASKAQYTVILDDPNDLKPGFIAFDILTTDAWGSNSMMGYGIRSELTLKRYGFVNFDFRRAYLDANGSAGYPKHKALELGFSLNLFSGTVKKTLPVVLSSSTSILSSGKRLLSYTYTEATGTKKQFLQARAGISSFRAGIDEAPGYNDRKEYDGRFFLLTKGSDTAVIGYGPGYMDYDVSPPYGIRAFMKLNMLNVGLSYRSLANLWIRNGADGDVAANTSDYNFYFDYLIGLSTVFQDPSYLGSSGMGNFSDWNLEVINLKETGWRMGLEAKKHQALSMTYKAEFGSRPGFTSVNTGILSPNFYIMLTAGFGIGVGKSIK